MLLILSPQVAAADEADDCLRLTVRNTPHTCKNPNPLLALFWGVPAYFTVAENRCDRDILLVMEQDVKGGRVTGGAYSVVRARQHGDLVGCGEVARPLGWCFRTEFKARRCEEGTFRSLESVQLEVPAE
mgnify:CR=1 FL=1